MSTDNCMADRDPRRDPLPGDRLKDRFGQIIIVRELGPGESRDLALWRRAMKGAWILEVRRRPNEHR